MKGDTSCLQWRGKDLDCFRASFNQIQLKSCLHSHCIHLSFLPLWWEFKSQIYLKDYMLSWTWTLFMYLREFHHSFLKVQHLPKKKKKRAFENIGRQWAVARL